MFEGGVAGVRAGVGAMITNPVPMFPTATPYAVPGADATMYIVHGGVGGVPAYEQPVSMYALVDYSQVDGAGGSDDNIYGEVVEMRFNGENQDGNIQHSAKVNTEGMDGRHPTLDGISSA